MSSPIPPRRPQAPRIHPATRWHRLLGIISTAIVLVTITTGIVLNHGDALGLPDRRAANAVVNALYGIEPAVPGAAYETAAGWVVEVRPRVYLGSEVVFDHDAELVGAVHREDTLLLAFTDGVFTFDDAGEWIDSYEALDGLETPLRRIGTAGESTWLDTGGGIRAFGDADTLPASPAVPVDWSTRAELPARAAAALARAHTGGGISYERLLLDLHSGRLFGGVGVWIVDLAAVCLLAMALTGIYMWFKFKRNGNAVPRAAKPDK